MIKDILHLKAPGNWMNDPNGFIWYQGRYHLFYQYFPYAAAWGTMHWGHAVSEDLIHWQHTGAALFPTKEYDRNGIFSGSALEKDGALYLYYSAVRYSEEDKENIHQAKNGEFVTSQALIVSEDGLKFDNWNGKHMIIPVSQDEDIADPAHTRDPKVWKDKDDYYMVLGSTFKGETGRIVFYKSKDAKNWEYKNQYRDAAYGNILECPDLFKIGDNWVFTGSPMNIMNDGLKYADHAVCALADFKEESCELSLPEKYQFVDYGLDLYAAQSNLDRDGRRVIIGWIRMPVPVESKEEERKDWIGMMCLPRVVEVEEGHICFRVHPEADRYFNQELKGTEEINYGKPYRLQTVLEKEAVLNIGGYKIEVADDCLRTDRSKVFGETAGYRTVSVTPALHGKYCLDIFVEPNLIEIFINGGQYVVSSTVYGLEHRIEGHVERIFSGSDR